MSSTAAREQLKSEIASIEDLCVHLRIVRGRCLSGNSTGETLISANTAAAEHLTVGGTLATTDENRGHDPAACRRGVPPGRARRVVLGAVGPVPVRPAGSDNAPPPGDASFVTSAALTSRLQRVPQTLSANVALLPGDVGYDDIGELRTHDRARECHCRAPHLTRRRRPARPSPP